jgi:hypothetical protein
MTGFAKLQAPQIIGQKNARRPGKCLQPVEHPSIERPDTRQRVEFVPLACVVHQHFESRTALTDAQDRIVVSFINPGSGAAPLVIRARRLTR